MKILKFLLKLFIYLVGMFIIALGINISKLSTLGISPVSSIPGALNAVFPDFSLGAMVIIVYCVLVIAQIIVLRKNFKAKNIMGVPVAIIFGWMIDFIGIADFKFTVAGIPLGIEKTFTGAMKLIGIPAPVSILMRFAYLAASIIVIAIGVYIYLKPRFIPMPAEGLAVAISEVAGMPFGNCKTAVDMSLIIIAAIIQLISFGFPSFMIGKGIVGIGTIISAFSVGQVVKIIAKILKK